MIRMVAPYVTKPLLCLIIFLLPQGIIKLGSHLTPVTCTTTQESGIDGERIARERAEADRARRNAEAAQTAFFATQPTRPKLTDSTDSAAES
jgi:hypothetical protein